MSRNGEHEAHLEDVCMAAMPDVAARLRRGGRVAELGWEAGRAGLTGRVVFHVAPPDEAPLDGPYDLVAAFDGGDDFAHSLRTLRRMRHLAAPSGTVVVAAGAGDDALVDAVYARAAGFSKVDLLPVPGASGRLFRLTP